MPKPPALRVVGTSATLTPALRAAAQRDLPFAIDFSVLDGVSCQRRGVMAPDSYDVLDEWFHSLDLFWTAGAIKPIETGRITRWSELQIAGSDQLAQSGFGTRPSAIVAITPARRLGPLPAGSDRPAIAMLPTSYNLDSFAYTQTPWLQDAGPASWGWLLDDRLHGRVSLGQDPAASAVELAIAARALGWAEVADPASLSIEEIDLIFDKLMALKRIGHFATFWESAEHSVQLMRGAQEVISPLWSPAFYKMHATMPALRYAVPREGYRGWHSGLCLSREIDPEIEDMAYAYMNWWLEGVAGAIMARQGYYMSVVSPLRQTLTPQEWDYWYGGLQTEVDLIDEAGRIVVRAGECRSGGSYLERGRSIAVWSTIMPEHNYLVRRWRDFIQA